MKFAKELEDDLVPEWRVKYLDYKAGKKKIKAVSRAFRNVNRTPRSNGRPEPQTATSQEALPFTHYDFNQRNRPAVPESLQAIANGEAVASANDGRMLPQRRESVTMFAKSPPVLMPESQPVSNMDSRADSSDSTPETTPLQPAISQRRTASYGSIVGTPPDDSPALMATLELPDPALSPARTRQQQLSRVTEMSPDLSPHTAPVETSPDAYHVGKSTPPPKMGSSLPRRLFRKNTQPSTVRGKPSTFPKSKLRRMFTAHQLESPQVNDVQLEAYKELDNRQDAFFGFLDKELAKIEDFYKMKEEEANERLHVLRSQLHELRDCRLEDIRKAKGDQTVQGERSILNGILPVTPLPNMPLKEHAQSNGYGAKALKSVENALIHKPSIGKTSEAMQQLGSPTGPKGKARRNEDKQDYVRRKHPNEHVPYRFAKRRLKLALQEFYRGLELLKSYALLNRTGFRKINKKYDKAVNARPTGRYMSEKVSQAYFVQSDVIEGHLVAVEDLYARYFERGNHKMAVGKLRSRAKGGDQSSVSFRNGLYVAAGTCFAVAGLVNACARLFSSDPTLSIQTSYLLQIYAGYFLALLLFLLFVLDCKIWTTNRINYTFVFEYDTRHTLDWRQLAELPCFFLFLNGLFLFLNFQQSSNDSFYLYWPVILIAITVVIMALPFRLIYYQARRWWGFSNWRLLLAGLYPVEFRDFYLGDMYCSATYTLGQIELFFCLYANDWNNPSQCNSSHSRLLGFFAALPAIWRALQCLRRYYDSRNWFPHLANFAKYCCNILYYMSLSLYRIDKTGELHALFITFACINAIYCSFWDVFMDFSLGDPWAANPFLRDQLAYKRVWVYYFAIVGDVFLRQQWILYAIFTKDLQHSSIVSFFVALAEVLRRGMWSLFRVENEHCNNVGKFRASRDIPLPYDIPDSPELSKKSPEQQRKDAVSEAGGQTATGVDLELASTADSSTSLRKRTPAQTPGLRALQRVGTVIAAAHAQDFEKKRRPEVVGAGPGSPGLADEHSSDDDDDEEEDEQQLHDRLNSEDIRDANGLLEHSRRRAGR